MKVADAVVISTIALAVVFMLGLMLGTAAGERNADKRWQAEAVARGAAEYDRLTGKWRWNKEVLFTGQPESPAGK